MRRFGTLATLIPLAMSVPAYAADVGTIVVADPVAPAAPAPESPPTWTGFFVGVDANVGAAILEYTQQAIPNTGDPDVVYDFGEIGTGNGFHVGFDYELFQLAVLGVEYSRGDQNVAFAPNGSGGFGDLFSAASTSNLSVRAGILANPGALVYARLSRTDTDLAAEAGLDDTATGSSSGTSLGLGVEAMVGRYLSARVEVDQVVGDEAFAVPEDLELFDPRFLNISAGLSYRFGLPGLDAPGDAAPRETPATNWTGFYAGIARTYAFGTTDFDVDVPGATVGPYGAEASATGFFLGGDLAFGPGIVVGGELERNSFTADFNDPAFNEVVPDAPTRFATVTTGPVASARLGLLVNPATLVYAKAGTTSLDIAANPDFFALDDNEDLESNLPATLWGFGIEAGINEHLTVRAEASVTEANEGLVVNNTQLDQVTLTPRLVTGTLGFAVRF